MFLKRKAWTGTVSSAILAVSLVMMPASSAFAAAPSQQNMDTLVQVYKTLVDQHYTHPDENTVLQGAIDGMLKTINDPFTTYFTPDQYKQFVNAINQTPTGIGVQLAASPDGNALQVVDVFDGTPAQKAGLQKGDLIVQVNDLVVTGQNLPDAAQALQGPAGESVTLKFVRGTAAVQTLTLQRQAFEVPEVSASDLGQGVGYLRIYSFGERTTAEFQKEWNTLSQTSTKGLVLDLRGNGGGLVQSALEIADMFLKEGTILVIHDEKGQAISIDADSEGSDVPLTVLVDQNTASASEMLAGALQKNKRATLIGVKTFGKGTMQEPVELPNGGYIKVSVDRWELADGKSPDHVGLQPDVYLTRNSAVLNAAMQHLLPDRQQTLTFDRTSDTGSLNGMTLKDMPATIKQDGQLYLPLRYTVEELGSEVDWDGQAVSFALCGHNAIIDAAHVLYVDKQPVPSAIRVIGGTTYITAAGLQAITGHPVDVTATTITVQA